MITKYVSEGEKIPLGYGVSWYDVLRRQAVCLPIPFNRVMNILRKTYYWFINPSIPNIEKRLAVEFQKGVKETAHYYRKRLQEEREEGKKEGWDLCIQFMTNEINKKRE